MKIIDAYWEKRNLGVTTVEVEIEKEDTIKEIETALRNLDGEYLVVRIPAGKMVAMFLVSQMGFDFVESSIHVTHDLKNIELNGIQKRLIDSVNYSPMNSDDIEELFVEIRNGMFESDRISLDPYFSADQTAKRYIGWIKDELERDTELFKLAYKDNTFGFFTFKSIGEGIYYPFLAGIYKQYRKSGLGISIAYKPLCEAVRRKGKMVSTQISTNNGNTVKIHSIMGFEFREIHYVYIRHNAFKRGSY